MKLPHVGPGKCSKNIFYPTQKFYNFINCLNCSLAIVLWSKRNTFSNVRKEILIFKVLVWFLEHLAILEDLLELNFKKYYWSAAKCPFSKIFPTCNEQAGRNTYSGMYNKVSSRCELEMCLLVRHTSILGSSPGISPNIVKKKVAYKPGTESRPSLSLGTKRVKLANSAMASKHRIKDDRMENSIKGIQIWHCAFAASIILCSTPT